MTWLIFWSGLALGFALGIVWSVAFYFVVARPAKRIKLPRALVIDDGSARWPWRRS